MFYDVEQWLVRKSSDALLNLPAISPLIPASMTERASWTDHDSAVVPRNLAGHEPRDTAPKIGEPFHTFRIAIRTYIVRDTAGFPWSSLPDLKCKMPCRGCNACGKSVEESVVEQSMRYAEG